MYCFIDKLLTIKINDWAINIKQIKNEKFVKSLMIIKYTICDDNI